MNLPRSVRITGWGAYAPETVLTNADLARIVDTSDEWITSRTGIRERRVAGPARDDRHHGRHRRASAPSRSPAWRPTTSTSSWSRR